MEELAASMFRVVKEELLFDHPCSRLHKSLPKITNQNVRITED
jgi:hypothetical protein